MKPYFPWLIFIGCCLFFSSNAQQDPASQLRSLIEEDQQFQKKEFSSPGQDFPAIAPADEIRRAEFYRQELARLNKIDKAQLSRQDKISYELLKYVLEDRIAEVEFEAYLVPLNAEGGWYTDFVLSIDYQRFNTKEDFEKYIRKLAGFKNWAAQNLQLMEAGLAKGRTAPLDILKGRENIVDHLVVDRAEESPFYKPFENMPPEIAEADQEKLRKEARSAIMESVVPGYRAFQDFWKNEYIPGAVKSPGIAVQPNGGTYYEQRVRYFTTLPMTADEVFEIGQREVARIRTEMEAIIREVEFDGSFADFLQFLRTDPQFYPKTPRELLQAASYFSKKIDGKLPEYFGKLPRNSYGVSPVPDVLAPTYTGGRYSPGSLEHHRAGFYWVNTYNLPSRPLYVLPSLTLHEAVPGHHLQISLAQELEGVPDFRRNTYLSAFGEGWALYGEWLGQEMGIYETPYEQFGRLTYEMWRACRLVVDPGLHVKGWSREQAIEFMAGNTALSLHECTTEIDRYIGWPGQAVSYKIGELKIRELRKKAEEFLGEKFDLRAFHDLVLSEGAVPLFVLEEMVNEWMEAVSKK
jgi:uncharacterized protein (DUF885 family)